MKQFSQLVVCVLALTFTACKKAGNADISGTVTEKGTNLPFPNAQVFVERTTRSGLNSNLDRTIVANTITDANGDYELDFFMNPKFLYNLYCTSVEDENGKTYSKIEWADIPKKDISVDFKLPPIAFLKIILHKSSYTVSDYAAVVVDHSKSFQIDLPNSPFDSILGVYSVVGNENIYVSWSQRYNTPSIWAQDLSTLSINKGDTLIHHINFN